jgi:hypothetical protein
VIGDDEHPVSRLQIPPNFDAIEKPQQQTNNRSNDLAEPHADSLIMSLAQIRLISPGDQPRFIRGDSGSRIEFLFFHVVSPDIESLRPLVVIDRKCAIDLGRQSRACSQRKAGTNPGSNNCFSIND